MVRGPGSTPTRYAERKPKPPNGRGAYHVSARQRRVSSDTPVNRNMPTTYSVILETETRPREAAVALDHLPAIQVDAPNVDIAARLALSHHIDSRPAPPPAGTSVGLLVITPPPHDPKAPHHDLDDEAEICRLNVEYWPTATAVH